MRGARGAAAVMSTETLDLQGRAVQGRARVSAVQEQGGSSARSLPVGAPQGRSAAAQLALQLLQLSHYMGIPEA